jgi:hypothetical protein
MALRAERAPRWRGGLLKSERGRVIPKIGETP